MPQLLKASVGAVIVAATLGMTGCATIVHGDTQTLRVKSKPNHAQVVVDGQSVGRTPAKLSLARSRDHTVEVSLPGYATTQFALTRRMSGWFIGNIFLGGIIGMVVDAASGAMYTLTPQEVAAYAKATEADYHAKSNTLMIFLVNKADPSWHKVGQLRKV